MKNESLPIFKIALIGSHSSGKTAIITAYHSKTFYENFEATIGANFISHEISIDGNEIELQIWDTAGQDRFKSIGPLYYRDAQCCVVVYDAINSDSFNEMNEYICDYLECSIVEGLIYIVCNKCDLVDDNSNKLIMKGKQYAEEHKFPFFETSAKTQEGIDDLFNDIARKLIEKRSEFKKSNVNDNNSQEKSGCC